MSRAACPCEDLVNRVRVHISGGSSAHPYSNIVRSFPEITSRALVRPQGVSLSSSKPTVSPLLTPVASRNLLLYQSLPTSVRYRHANWRRRNDDPCVGTAAR